MTEPYFKRRSSSTTRFRGSTSHYLVRFQTVWSVGIRFSVPQLCALGRTMEPLWDCFTVSGVANLAANDFAGPKRIIAGPEVRAVVQATDSDMPHGSCSGSNAASESWNQQVVV